MKKIPGWILKKYKGVGCIPCDPPLYLHFHANREIFTGPLCVGSEMVYELAGRTIKPLTLLVDGNGDMCFTSETISRWVNIEWVDSISR